MRIAEHALNGVGDARLGEWRERGRGGVYHIRRRLSVDEESIVGGALDIRGTPEEQTRMSSLLAAVDPRVAEILSLAAWSASKT